jgi:hypothetical protein
MPDWIVGLLLATGASAWLYSKLNRRSGGVNSSQVLIIVGVIGLIIFFATIMILGALFKKH